jgi:hypothetical protein
MGAWGYGILQNDDAQDGLVDLIRFLEEDFLRIGRGRCNERGAARLGAAVGLLLQLGACRSFSPDSLFSSNVAAYLDYFAPQIGALPRRARTLLHAVFDGKGPGLAARRGKMSRLLRQALFATEKNGFPMERVFSRREPALFEHREAARYVQEFADHCVSVVEADFQSVATVDELYRSHGMAAFGTLLVLEPCHVKPSKFVAWRKRWHAVLAAHDEEFEPDDFEREYNKNVELAFQLAMTKFAKK